MVAKSVHGVKTATITSKEVLEESKYVNAVFIYPPAKCVSDKYEKARSRYPSKTLKAETLEKFIYEKSVPLVGEKSAFTGVLYDKQQRPVVTVFADNAELEKNEKQFNYYANRMRKVAVEYKNKLIFAVASKADYSYELPDYGLDLEKGEAGVGIREGSSFYKMSESFGIENVQKFIKAYLAGDLTPKVKDDRNMMPEEEEEDSGPSSVVTLTDSNFAAQVTNSPNDVMLEFYAPWCGHCKALKPEYEQVARALEDVSTVTVGAFDATANTVPSNFEVQGYPTLMFLKANDKKTPIPYEGDRQAGAILDFIKKHAGIPFEI